MAENFSRRELFACLVAGGFIVAGKLWIPGARKIFILSDVDFLDEHHLLLDWPKGRIIASLRYGTGVELIDGALQLCFGLGHKTGTIYKIQLSHGRGVLPFKNPIPVKENDGVIVTAKIDHGELIMS